VIKKATSWAVLIYGILIILLGSWGYYERGSNVSLYSGVGFGALLVLSSWALFAHKKWGSVAALILTLALTIVFAIRSSHTGAPIPSVMAVLSGGMLLFLLARITRWKR